jgi:hypothetical protein
MKNYRVVGLRAECLAPVPADNGYGLSITADTNDVGGYKLAWHGHTPRQFCRACAGEGPCPMEAAVLGAWVVQRRG